jgi:hypothetical protein
MSNESKNQYQEGHLFVAAIRLLEHQNGTPPTLGEISELLDLSAEQTGLISRRLVDVGIIKIVESAFGDRWGIEDHLKIEALPKEAATNQIDDALKQFKAEKSKMAKKIAAIKEEQAKKQKDLFSEIEKKLKKDMGKK